MYKQIKIVKIASLRFLAGMTVLIAVCFLLTGCDSSSSVVHEIPVIPVIVARPSVRDVPRYIESVGILEPSFFVEIRPQITGIVEKVFAQEGAWVDAGAPLFQLDSKAYQIRVKEAEAQLLIDQVIYDAAKKTTERFYSLAEEDLVSRVEWDGMEMHAAKSEASLALDHARLDAAKLDLEHCLLKAPKSGRIGRLDVHQGTLVSAGQSKALTTLSRSDPLIVNFSITEKEFSQLPQEKLSVEVKSLCEKDCNGTGTITFLDHRFDAKSGLLFMRGELCNTENRLSQGQSVSVSIPIAIDSQVILIPQRAVKYNQQGPYIYVVSPEKNVEFRQLTLGDEVDEEVVVREGVSTHELVITSGHTRLSPGIKVEVQQ